MTSFLSDTNKYQPLVTFIAEIKVLLHNLKFSKSITLKYYINHSLKQSKNKLESFLIQIVTFDEISNFKSKQVRKFCFTFYA